MNSDGNKSAALAKKSTDNSQFKKPNYIENQNSKLGQQNFPANGNTLMMNSINLARNKMKNSSDDQGSGSDDQESESVRGSTRYPLNMNNVNADKLKETIENKKNNQFKDRIEELENNFQRSGNKAIFERLLDKHGWYWIEEQKGNSNYLPIMDYYYIEKMKDRLNDISQ